MAKEEQQQQNKEQPIIIKKRKGTGHGAPHGGAWKVAYADFVTAMMAFFIVMWIMGQSETVKKKVQNFFNDPGAFSYVTGKRTIPVDLGLTPVGLGEEKGRYKEVDKYVFMALPDDTTSKSKQLREKAIFDSVKAAERVTKTAEDIKKIITQELAKKPELKDILSSIKIEMTKEGLRIELIESKDALFFEIGSAKISRQAKDVLIQLGREIGKLPNYVEIEGHTDSRKYSGQSSYTNWNLSSDRANSAREILEQNGLWDNQISKVTGFSDRKLRDPSNPFDLSNRRVSILVQQLKIKDLLPPNQEEGAKK